ncbi:MAG: class I SAM-dependent methyltransferase [Planctomycetes bacterium]|nr:class I SAM-dependent methyltransferase [Planctomycetota bacterium]
MAEFRAADWQTYRMEWKKPHDAVEPLENEIRVVDAALAGMLNAGLITGVDYDGEKFLAHRRAVRENFDIPWTAITPRMQRLLYAINAVHRPPVLVAVGIFCGNTFISNAGAAAGPGKCYDAERLVGIEIKPEEADRARRNVQSIDTEGRAEIVAADGMQWLKDFDGGIDLLYLDADGPKGKGKSIYMDLLEAALHALKPASLVIAHNSINSASDLADYLAFVRGENFASSINMFLDDQGIEVSRMP